MSLAIQIDRVIAALLADGWRPHDDHWSPVSINPT
jgi:hypothetical protein